MNDSQGTNGSFPTSQLPMGHMPVPDHVTYIWRYMGQVPHLGPGSSGAQNGISFFLLPSAILSFYLDMNLMIAVGHCLSMIDKQVEFFLSCKCWSMWSVRKCGWLTSMMVYCLLTRKFLKKRHSGSEPPGFYSLYLVILLSSVGLIKYFYPGIQNSIDELYFINLILF